VTLLSTIGQLMGAVLAASHHHTTAESVAGIIAFIMVGIILIFLIAYLSRWKRVRGATSRAEAINRAFGPGASRVVMYVSFGFAAVLFVMLIVIKTTGGG
jgi:uncharacterized membrane protein